MAQWIPSALFQSSVLPVKDLAMKGIWWYQGESNANDPRRYDEKFKAMVLKFREVFNDDLPIICTVMADFDDPANGKNGDIATGFPDDGLTIQDGWKTVQEMQLNAPEMVPLCASVSAKDLSEPFELHPQNKSILGARFAEKAMLWI
jgi:sialate O-acetylesterase